MTVLPAKIVVGLAVLFKSTTVTFSSISGVVIPSKVAFTLLEYSPPPMLALASKTYSTVTVALSATDAGPVKVNVLPEIVGF